MNRAGLLGQFLLLISLWLPGYSLAQELVEPPLESYSHQGPELGAHNNPFEQEPISPRDGSASLPGVGDEAARPLTGRVGGENRYPFQWNQLGAFPKEDSLHAPSTPGSVRLE